MVTKKEIIDEYEKGSSCRKVAMKLGVSKSWVYLVVKEAGINRSNWTLSKETRRDFAINSLFRPYVFTERRKLVLDKAREKWNNIRKLKKLKKLKKRFIDLKEDIK